MKTLVITLLILAGSFLAITALAAPPKTISYQGYLKDSAGKPVTTATNLTFRLYSSTSGAGAVWQESRSVIPANGIYTIGLGEVTPLTVTFNRQYYLGIQVGTDPEMRPLQMLLAVPYALHSLQSLYSLQSGCYPGDMLNCYTGPPETLNQGICKSGVRTCSPDGSGFGTCVGEFTPNCNGACLDFSSNVNNCGSCGAACFLSNATPSCQNSVCTVAACNAGWGNCDGNNANGCETNTTNSASNCGACNNVCAIPVNANSVVCQNSACKVGSCSSGWGDCDGNFANGCETNIMNNGYNCGVCNNVCTYVPHAFDIGCHNGICTFLRCDPGWGDCDGIYTNGCETDIYISTSNCGACGNACAVPAHATATCTIGTCGFTCNSGYANCNGNAADGCEINILTNNNNCGTCGNVCGITRSCVSGVCQLLQ